MIVLSLLFSPFSCPLCHLYKGSMCVYIYVYVSKARNFVLTRTSSQVVYCTCVILNKKYKISVLINKNDQITSDALVKLKKRYGRIYFNFREPIHEYICLHE